MPGIFSLGIACPLRLERQPAVYAIIPYAYSQLSQPVLLRWMPTKDVPDHPASLRSLLRTQVRIEVPSNLQRLARGEFGDLVPRQATSRGTPGRIGQPGFHCDLTWDEADTLVALFKACAGRAHDRAGANPGVHPTSGAANHLPYLGMQGLGCAAPAVAAHPNPTLTLGTDAAGSGALAGLAGGAADGGTLNGGTLGRRCCSMCSRQHCESAGSLWTRATGQPCMCGVAAGGPPAPAVAAKGKEADPSLQAEVAAALKRKRGDEAEGAAARKRPLLGDSSAAVQAPAHALPAAPDRAGAAPPHMHPRPHAAWQGARAWNPNSIPLLGRQAPLPWAGAPAWHGVQPRPTAGPPGHPPLPPWMIQLAGAHAPAYSWVPQGTQPWGAAPGGPLGQAAPSGLGAAMPALATLQAALAGLAGGPRGDPASTAGGAAGAELGRAVAVIGAAAGDALAAVAQLQASLQTLLAALGLPVPDLGLGQPLPTHVHAPPMSAGAPTAPDAAQASGTPLPGSTPPWLGVRLRHLQAHAHVQAPPAPRSGPVAPAAAQAAGTPLPGGTPPWLGVRLRNLQAHARGHASGAPSAAAFAPEAAQIGGVLRTALTGESHDAAGTGSRLSSGCIDLITESPGPELGLPDHTPPKLPASRLPHALPVFNKEGPWDLQQQATPSASDTVLFSAAAAASAIGAGAASDASDPEGLSADPKGQIADPVGLGADPGGSNTGKPMGVPSVGAGMLGRSASDMVLCKTPAAAFGSGACSVAADCSSPGVPSRLGSGPGPARVDVHTPLAPSSAAASWPIAAHAESLPPPPPPSLTRASRLKPNRRIVPVHIGDCRTAPDAAARACASHDHAADPDCDAGAVAGPAPAALSLSSGMPPRHCVKPVPGRGADRPEAAAAGAGASALPDCAADTSRVTTAEAVAAPAATTLEGLETPGNAGAWQARGAEGLQALEGLETLEGNLDDLLANADRLRRMEAAQRGEEGHTVLPNSSTVVQIPGTAAGVGLHRGTDCEGLSDPESGYKSPDRDDWPMASDGEGASARLRAVQGLINPIQGSKNPDGAHTPAVNWRADDIRLCGMSLARPQERAEGGPQGCNNPQGTRQTSIARPPAADWRAVDVRVCGGAAPTNPPADGRGGAPSGGRGAGGRWQGMKPLKGGSALAKVTRLVKELGVRAGAVSKKDRQKAFKSVFALQAAAAAAQAAAVAGGAAAAAEACSERYNAGPPRQLCWCPAYWDTSVADAAGARSERCARRLCSSCFYRA